jgi:hypothetical protein
MPKLLQKISPHRDSVLFPEELIITSFSSMFSEASELPGKKQKKLSKR